MPCQVCNKNRVLSIQAHSRDCNELTLGVRSHSGYLPEMENLGGGDDMYIEICLDCGQVQGKWPVETPKELKEDSDE